jgi:hypothetical protein
VQLGTASERPMYTAFPGSGGVAKQATPCPATRSCVWSTGGSVSTSELVATWAHAQGTMGSLSATVKITGSVPSSRRLAICVPACTTTGSSCGAESRNVTSQRAADGGNSRTPIRSRKRR